VPGAVEAPTVEAGGESAATARASREGAAGEEETPGVGAAIDDGTPVAADDGSEAGAVSVREG
jgi:hypothetical protein